MIVTLYLLLSMLVGVGMATQLSMLGAMGRDRGPFEGAWLSLIGSATGLALVLAVHEWSEAGAMLALDDVRGGRVSAYQDVTDRKLGFID